VSEFENVLDERPHNIAYEENNRVSLCDFCSRGTPFDKQPRVAQYYADRVCHDTTESARKVNARKVLTPLATYCEDCSHRLLFFPCNGYTEARVFVTLDSIDKADIDDTVQDNTSADLNAVLRDPDVVDVSPATNGIPWNPPQLSEKITGVSFDKHTKQAGFLMGPENVLVFFLAATDDMDVRKVINPDGSLDPKALGRARRKYESVRSTLRNDNYDRVTFRDHVSN